MEETKVEIMETKRNNMFKVSPYNIIIEDGFNTRQDYGNIDELKNSIIENGQLEPVIGHKKNGTEQYVLTDGHRRYTAIMKAIEEGHDIPYISLTIGSSNQEDRIFAMVVTGTGKKPLTAVEEGEAYKKLVNLGYSVEKIAKRVGKSIPHVYNLINIGNMPEIVKQEIQEGTIAASTVVRLSKEVKNVDEFKERVNNAVTQAKAEGKKRATNTAVLDNGLSPQQKLLKAYQLCDDKESNGAKQLIALYNLFENKNSLPSDILKVFI